MRKIAILVNTLNRGGAEKQSIYLLKALEDKYSVLFVVMNGKSIDYNFVRQLINESPVFLKLEGNIVKKIIGFRKIILNNNIDTLFTFLTKPNFFGSFIAKTLGVNSIYGSIRNSVVPNRKLVFEIISSKFFCKKMIINNYRGKEFFSKRNIKNLVVIHNAFPNIQKPFIRKKSRIPKIISIGRFVKQKDYYTALKAIKVLEKRGVLFTYNIVGYGILENYIRNLIKKLELNNHVYLINNHKEIINLLSVSDIYLSTSLFEGLSNSIMEAMNASLPIVATNVGDNDKLVYNEENGYLHKIKDHKEIAQSLEKLINNYELRIKFGVNSNRILNNSFSFIKFEKKYLDLIENN